jgi:mercuric reductase
MGRETHVDFVILGSGSTAFAAAIKASEHGKTVIMTEERTIGGTCVNRGCVPSKNLIEAAHLWHNAGHPRFPGLDTRQERLDFRQLIAQKDETIGLLRKKKYTSIAEASDRIQIKQGHTAFVGAHTIDIDGERITGEQILIATGSRPVTPPVSGLDSIPFLTSDLLTSRESQELTELPPVLVIIGGGYIALELGQMFARLGSHVTILEQSEHILPNYEPEIGLTLQSLLQMEGIDLRTNTKAERVEKTANGVHVCTSNGIIEATHLLVATGRRPNSDQLNLAAAGIETDARGFVRVDEYLRTNVPHIWAAGDVIGGQMATPVGAHDGAIVAENAFAGANRRTDRTIIPRAIFTDPQVGVVGLTDEETVAKGLDCRCETVEMAHVPRAAAIGDTRGLIKMVIEEESERIVGVSILAPHASELIHIAALALRAKMTLDDLIESIFVYPTFSEALKIAALAFRKDVSKLSCCAE